MQNHCSSVRKFIITKNLLSVILFTASALVISPTVWGAAFQLFEQDGASIANYHAGYAALANDASTAFYNPAGIVRIPNQQLVFSGDTVMTSFKYRGTVMVNTINNFQSFGVTAQGGSLGFIPAVHYVVPLCDRVGFGFSVDVPFGLKVDYGSTTVLRYISTQSSVKVVDISPTIGIRVTDKASVGFGPDIQPMSGEFDMIGTFAGADLDSDGINKAEDTGYGYHLGALYEFSPATRVGASYHSQVVHHLTGTSDFMGPLAQALDATIHSDRSKVNITLPPYTAISIFHRLHSQFAIMGSVIYTQWRTLQNLVLQDIAGIALNSIGDPVPSVSLTTIIPQHFHNTWNFSIGADYYVADNALLRTGIGYDQTPVGNAYRNVQMPDNDRYVIALGGHYQATKAIGLDLAWSHIFFNKAHVIPPEQITGAQIGRTNGSVSGGADVFGTQLTWDIV